MNALEAPTQIENSFETPCSLRNSNHLLLSKWRLSRQYLDTLFHGTRTLELPLRLLEDGEDKVQAGRLLDSLHLFALLDLLMNPPSWTWMRLRSYLTE